MSGAFSFYADAVKAAAAGLCPIPVSNNGSKGPGLRQWRQYVVGREEFTGERPSETDLRRWFAQGDPPGIGLVCGAISGRLEMLEVEGRFADKVADVEAAIVDAGLGELWQRIDSGYRERTPSGGIHWLYRLTEGDVEGNRKIASRPVDEAPYRLTLIETRGEGGFVVVAPTMGMFDGYDKLASWRLEAGGFGSIATITPAEREELVRLLSTFDELPEPETVPAPTTNTRLDRSGILEDSDRPGDEFNRSTNWHDLLEPEGWQPLFTRGDVIYWRRPGKTSGISATTNALGTDRLKVFSTSTVFDTDRTYDRFGAYARLRHSGDLQAAARAIRPSTEPAPKPRTVLDGPMLASDGFDDTAAISGPPEKLLDEFLGESEEAYDWLIDDLIERGDRLILTATEGLGKSTLLRQIAATAAAGIHPFTGAELAKPLTSLIVDFENSRRHVRRQLGPLREAAGKPIRLYVVVQPAGMDMATEVDRGWLEGIIARSKPDLVVLGPVYKMASGDPVDEVPSKAVAMEIDRLRTVYGFAVLVEHHQPYGDGAKRPLRPYGWSGWARWPEFGLALVGKPEDEEVEVHRWRGDRDARQWPKRLRKHGEPWPFEDAGDERNRTSVAEVKAAAQKLVAEGLDREPLPAELAEATGFPEIDVARVIGNPATGWRAFMASLGLTF